MRQRVLIVGAAAGAIGGCLTLATTAMLGWAIGGALGVAASALVGAAATWWATDTLGRRMIENLIALAPIDGERPAGRLISSGWHEIDDRIDALGQSLADLEQVRTDWEQVEQLARTIWASIDGTETEAVAGSEARPCVVRLLDEFRQAADSLVRDAGELGEATGRMASGAVDQSETVARTTTTVEALSDKIDRISEHAEEAAEAGERARRQVHLGLEQVQGIIEGMDRLRARAEANGRKARRLGDRSVEIGTIVELISGISTRTDMLALNATIESVRAGEHGRGFAVVAEEIRKLAERAASATREIGTLVEAIQADAEESIRSLGEEQAEMEKEAHSVREAGAALERISEVAEQSARLVDGISRSANDQVLATQELVRAMQRISEVSDLILDETSRFGEEVRSLVRRCQRLRSLSAVAGPPAPRPVLGRRPVAPDRRGRRLVAIEPPR